MKKTILPLLLALLTLASCRHEPKVEIIDRAEVTMPYGTFETLVAARIGDWTMRDSLGVGPMNELISFYDKNDSLVGLMGAASEVGCYDYVRIVRDKKGQITGYVMGNDCPEDDDDYFADYEYKEEESWYREAYRRMRFWLLEDTTDRLQRLMLQRDKEGRVIRVYDPVTKAHIDALEGQAIRCEVHLNQSFWASDFRGGIPFVNIIVESRSEGSLCQTVYVGYRKQYQAVYRNGRLCGMEIYGTETERFDVEDSIDDLRSYLWSELCDLRGDDFI